MDDTGRTEAELARERFELLRARLKAAKMAYLKGGDLDGSEVTYARLKRIAEEMIEANYELQRLIYGKIRLKFSVAKLLRRGR